MPKEERHKQSEYECLSDKDLEKLLTVYDSAAFSAYTKKINKSLRAVIRARNVLEKSGASKFTFKASEVDDSGELTGKTVTEEVTRKSLNLALTNIMKHISALSLFYRAGSKRAKRPTDPLNMKGAYTATMLSDSLLEFLQTDLPDVVTAENTQLLNDGYTLGATLQNAMNLAITKNGMKHTGEGEGNIFTPDAAFQALLDSTDSPFVYDENGDKVERPDDDTRTTSEIITEKHGDRVSTKQFNKDGTPKDISFDPANIFLFYIRVITSLHTRTDGSLTSAEKAVFNESAQNFVDEYEAVADQSSSASKAKKTEANENKRIQTEQRQEVLSRLCA